MSVLLATWKKATSFCACPGKYLHATSCARQRRDSEGGGVIKVRTLRGSATLLESERS